MRIERKAKRGNEEEEEDEEEMPASRVELKRLPRIFIQYSTSMQEKAHA